MDTLFGKTPVDPFATKVKPIESKEVFNQGATDNVYEGYKAEGMPATPGTGKVVSGRSNVLDNIQAKTDFGPTMSGSPKQSILGRVGDAIKGAPGKVSDFVTNTGEGGLLDYSYKKAAAVPGQMIDQGISGLIAGKPDAQKEYSQGFAPIQTDSYAASQLAGDMRSLDVYSQFRGFTDYMVPIMGTGTSDKGRWAMNLQQRTG